MSNDKEIFVFGSNLAGIHGAGAALVARREHGAKIGVGEGFTGNAYAIPTKGQNLEVLPLYEILRHAVEFNMRTYLYTGYQFKVTRIGCGRAGYTDEQIAWMFWGANHKNTKFDLAWKKWLPEEAQYWGTYE